MPLAWIYTLFKQRAEELAMQLGVPVEGTPDELVKRLKERWTAIEGCLPSTSEPKSDQNLSTVFPSINPEVHNSCHLSEMKVKPVSGLVKSVLLLINTDLEKVLRFLTRAKEVHDLGLVTDFGVVFSLVSRTLGRVTRIVGFHHTSGPTSGLDGSKLIYTFFCPEFETTSRHCMFLTA
jgi:hypothetical protein